MQHVNITVQLFFLEKEAFEKLGVVFPIKGQDHSQWITVFTKEGIELTFFRREYGEKED